MKKSLLFIVAAATSLSGFAQVDTLSNFQSSNPPYSSFANSASGVHYCQLDSPLAKPIPPAMGFGYVGGMNSAQWKGAAEAYNMTITPPATMSVTGVISVWAGVKSASSPTQVKYEIWTQLDTTTRVATGNGTDSVTGFPGSSSTYSEAKDLVSMTINNGWNLPAPGSINYDVMTFSSPTPITTPSFFLGYEFGTPGYTWGGADTVTLCAATHNNFVTQGHEDFIYKAETGYNLLSSRDAVEYSDGTWHDVYWEIGGSAGWNLFFCIVPVVQYSNAVGNINKNNLTTFSAYPNPAVNSLNIKYALQHSSDVTITIMDMAGRILNTINQSKVSTGEHVVNVSTSDLAAGNYVYLVRTAEGDALATKFTVAK